MQPNFEQPQFKINILYICLYSYDSAWVSTTNTVWRPYENKLKYLKMWQPSWMFFSSKIDQKDALRLVGQNVDEAVIYLDDICQACCRT